MISPNAQEATRLLLIGHDRADGKVLREALADTRDGPFILEWVTRLSDGLERLRRPGIALVLIDLSLPDSQGLASLEQLLPAASNVPVVVLSSLDDEGIAREAVQCGARDYLLKGCIDGHTLPRTLRTIIERRAMDETFALLEATFFEEKERAEVTLNSIGDGVLSSDLGGRVIYLNAVAQHLTGWSRAEAAGRPLTQIFRIIDGTTREPARNPMQVAIEQDTTVGLAANAILIRRDGSETAIEDSAAPIHDRAGHVTGAVMVFRDVTAERALSQQIVHLAQYDFLTDLPNRMLLNDRIGTAIAVAQRHGHQMAVLFLDLDRFKHVNDSLGHVLGDKLLQSVAGRLLTGIRRSDTVSRLSGDEFVVLLSEVHDASDAADSAQKILTALAAPHDLARHDVHVTVSVGVSIYPDDGQDAETLIKCADTAMYQAKESGRNTYRFCKPDMNLHAVERQWIEDGLRGALVRQEFVLHYQPKMNLETGAITGVEALIRWMHPERGLIGPKQFVPIAEDSGLIVPIGRWVLRKACTQARVWLDAGLRPTAMAVNISAIEFRRKDFVDNLRRTLEYSRLDPCYLELELTESVLMQHAPSTTAVLKALKEIGVQIAIDDFGTGYSSLSYLRGFPIDALKVDQSFVHEITGDPDGTPIVSAVIGMGKSLKHRVIAEGVETREQLAFLQAHHCGEGQGFYFSPPVTADQVAVLLETGMLVMPPHDESTDRRRTGGHDRRAAQSASGAR